jgi:uncharacterized protein YjbI with pentapeptide repeats
MKRIQKTSTADVANALFSVGGSTPQLGSYILKMNGGDPDVRDALVEAYKNGKFEGFNMEDIELVSRDTKDLRGVNLSGMDLSHADMRQVNLSRANLSGAILSRAHLEGADLTGANLTGATLFRTYLTGAVLEGANLSGAKIVEVEGLDTVDFTNAKGVTIAHVVGNKNRFEKGALLFSSTNSNMYYVDRVLATHAIVVNTITGAKYKRKMYVRPTQRGIETYVLDRVRNVFKVI